jgi:serine/threonine protein kinase
VLVDPSVFENLEGQALDEYIIESVLGRGGQAVVFLARHRTLQVKHAIKVFGLYGRGRRDFHAALEEARRQSKVEHPSVAKVYPPGVAELDFNGQATDVLYVPSQYASLGSCDEHPPFCATPFSSADLEAMGGLVDALGAIHASGLVHNDIKPANVLRFAEPVFGEPRMVLRITDFGTAAVINALDDTTPGFTPEYMAPEQPAGTPLVAADVYSMGATFFFMLTGRDPIVLGPKNAANHSTTDKPLVKRLAEWQHAHSTQPRPNVLDLNATCPHRLALLIMEMMSVAIEDRPSVQKCMEVLKTIGDEMKARQKGYAVPLELQQQFDRREYPIRYSSLRRQFKPDVYRSCGKQLAIIRIALTPHTLPQYERLTALTCRRYGDSFSMYETFGAFHVHIVVWTTLEQLSGFEKELPKEFPNSKIETALATNIEHLHWRANDSFARLDDTPESLNPVLALAVQDNIRLAGLRPELYLGDNDGASESDVGAFIYVRAALRAPSVLERAAIATEVRRALIGIRKNKGLTELTLIEFNATSSHALLVVRCAVAAYTELSRINTSISEIADGQIVTETMIESTRLSIVSTRIQF